MPITTHVCVVIGMLTNVKYFLLLKSLRLSANIIMMVLQKKLMQREFMEKDSLEKSIIRQIAEIDGQIIELNSEKSALQRLLLKSRKANVASRDVTRKNSIPRILVEQKIFEALEVTGKPLSNEELYRCTLAVIHDLNRNTFRSYIKRLKDNGKIIPQGSKWILPDPDKKE